MSQNVPNAPPGNINIVLPSHISNVSGGPLGGIHGINGINGVNGINIQLKNDKSNNFPKS